MTAVAARERAPSRSAWPWVGGVLLLAVPLGLTLLWCRLSLPMYEDDGLGLVTALSLARGGFVGWHHAAFLPLASLIERLVGLGHGLLALQWLSAAGAGLALVVLGALVRRERGGLAAWLSVAALAVSPSVWINATRVEVHTVQMLGAALLLSWCALARSRGTRGLVVGTFAAAVVAVTTHSTNVMLLPGAAWAAARAADGRLERRRFLLAEGAAGLGGYAGLVLDHLSLPGQSGSAVGDIADLWSNFAHLSNWPFVQDELILCWFPMLVAAGLVLASGRAGRRAALPHLLAAVPPVALFLASGIATRGGYFAGGMVFVVGAVLAVSRARPAPSPLSARLAAAVLVPTIVAGAALGWREATVPNRAKLAAHGNERLARAQRLLPGGGCIIEIDPLQQTLNGRVPGLFEVNLYPRLSAALRLGLDPAELVGRIESDIQGFVERGETLAWGRSWKFVLDVRPDLEAYMQPIEDMLGRYYALEKVYEGPEMYLRGPPLQAAPDARGTPR